MHGDTNVLCEVSRTRKHYGENPEKLARFAPRPTAVSAIAHEYGHAHPCDSREWPSHSTLEVQPTAHNSHFKFQVSLRLTTPHLQCHSWCLLGGATALAIGPVEDGQRPVTLCGLLLRESLCPHLVRNGLLAFCLCTLQLLPQFTHLCSQSTDSCLMPQDKLRYLALPLVRLVHGPLCPCLAAGGYGLLDDVRYNVSHCCPQGILQLRFELRNQGSCISRITRTTNGVVRQTTLAGVLCWWCCCVFLCWGALCRDALLWLGQLGGWGGRLGAKGAKLLLHMRSPTQPALFLPPATLVQSSVNFTVDLQGDASIQSCNPCHSLHGLEGGALAVHQEGPRVACLGMGNKAQLAGDHILLPVSRMPLQKSRHTVGGSHWQTEL